MRPGMGPTFLEAIYIAKRATEESTLDCCERNQALREAVFVVHPLDCPLSVFPDCWHCGNCIEDLLLLSRVPNILLDSNEYVSEWIFSIAIWKP